RSWKKAEKQAFVQLPPEVKSAIQRRDHEREVEVRRLQNELAELKKTATTAPSETVTSKETTNMAKQGYEKGVGPYSQNDVKLTRTDKGSGNSANIKDDRDISKIVDRNALDRPGPLDSGE